MKGLCLKEVVFEGGCVEGGDYGFEGDEVVFEGGDYGFEGNESGFVGNTFGFEGDGEGCFRLMLDALANLGYT